MKKERFLVLFSLIFLSCNTPSRYFSRPSISPTIANGDGTGYRNGELVNTTNMICVSPNDYTVIEDYFDDKEYRLYICLKYNRCN